MKTHGPAAAFWQAALGARTPGALHAVMEDFLDALRELFPEEVHGNVTLKSRDRWEGVAERLEWAGCPEYDGNRTRGIRFLYQGSGLRPVPHAPAVSVAASAEGHK